MRAPGDLRKFIPAVCFCFALCVGASASNLAPTNQSIPWAQLGASATAQYSGNGLGVIATPFGAQLRCVLQKLEGEVTAEGLSLRSTVPDARDQLHFTAARLGREGGQNLVLAKRGTVEIGDARARYLRPGLIEEYSATADGIRQDFLVTQPPAGHGPLRLHLTLRGARAETSPDGARLVFETSGRELNYHRLRVTDATGRQLAAWMEIPGKSEIRNPKSKMELAVEDAGAIYPLRIDPTFSDANWISMGEPPGALDVVNAAVADASGNLYIGGFFTTVGGSAASYVAKWDGNSWSALGLGVNDSVSALAISDNDLYAAGRFTRAGGSPANRIAKWNGTNWSALGSGINDGPVYALAVSGNDLFVGGAFWHVGGTAAVYVANIAKWNGSNWSALGSGMNSSVYALAVSGSDLFAGGYFTTAGGSAANRIAKWNASSWSALGGGVDNGVYALAASGNDLYAGGDFTTAGGSAADRIAKWDGSSWSALGWGMNDRVYALAVLGSQIYAGGAFTTTGGSVANRVAKWNGSSWSPLGWGMNNRVFALAASDNALYAGGEFLTATNSGGAVTNVNYIAEWNGSSWSALGSGITFWVRALAISGNDLYSGGYFTMAGGSLANRIAKWNGTNWSALGSGIGGGIGIEPPAVNTLVVSDNDLYAGGSFTTAGGNPANYIAKWNGSSWSALGLGVNNTVRALAVSGSDLYAAGTFTAATNGSGIAVTVNQVAKWNGSSWSALGSGMGGGIPHVYALAVSGRDLYAGGPFTRAGATNANHIAKWNGSTWEALGSGMNGRVSALAVSGGDVYAAGAEFTTAGGTAATNIAKWNGSSWSPLGSGIGAGGQIGGVFALALTGSDLYAAGRFTAAVGSPATNIAKWNGSSWSTLGSGVNRAVWALAVSGRELYAGGDFTTAGGKVSTYLAKARIGSSAESITASGSSATIQFSGVVGYEYHVQRTDSLAPPMTWATLTTDPLSPANDGSLTFTDTAAPPGTAYYRLVQN